jgi:hypothetical protein
MELVTVHHVDQIVFSVPFKTFLASLLTVNTPGEFSPTHPGHGTHEEFLTQITTGFTIKLYLFSAGSISLGKPDPEVLLLLSEVDFFLLLLFLPS